MRFGTRELLFLLLLIGMPVAAYCFVFQPRAEAVEEVREARAKKGIEAPRA